MTIGRRREANICFQCDNDLPAHGEPIIMCPTVEVFEFDA